MKWLIASDIHGSAYYCERLIEQYVKEKAHRLVLLGDILYHGPRNDLPRGYEPKKTAAMLNSMADSILCIRGNCDSEVDQMVLDFDILAPCAIIDLGQSLVYATHGHVFNRATPPHLKPRDILLHGHTHVPVCEDCGEFTYMNPGSVSIPKEDSAHSYMTLEDNVFQWKNLEGTIYNEYKI